MKKILSIKVIDTYNVKTLQHQVLLNNLLNLSKKKFIGWLGCIVSSSVFQMLLSIKYKNNNATTMNCTH